MTKMWPETFLLTEANTRDPLHMPLRDQYPLSQCRTHRDRFVLLFSAELTLCKVFLVVCLLFSPHVLWDFGAHWRKQSYPFHITTRDLSSCWFDAQEKDLDFFFNSREYHMTTFVHLLSFHFVQNSTFCLIVFKKKPWLDVNIIIIESKGWIWKSGKLHQECLK